MSPTQSKTRKPAKPSAKNSRQRILTAAHKRALADGRTMSATVDRYLTAVTAPKRRGRKVSTTTLKQRLISARTRFKSVAGVEKVLVAQEIRDLQARIDRQQSATAVDVKALEVAFVKIAKRFSDNRGIGYSAWRDAGVPAQVLKRAGVARSRR